MKKTVFSLVTLLFVMSLAVLAAPPAISGENVLAAKNFAGVYHSVTLKSDSSVTWSFDYGALGRDGVAIAETDNSVTITSKGNAGEVSVTAKNSDGEASQKTVYLYGTEYSRPGLDIITGTEKPCDFEVFDALSDGDNGIFVTGKASLSSNGNGKAVCLEGNGSFIHTAYHPNMRISNDRPVRIEYTCYSESNEDNGVTWLLVNSGAEVKNSVFAPFTQKSDGNAKKESFDVTVSGFAHEDAFKESLENNVHKLGLMSGAAGKVYIDDLRIMPYYKVTYMGFDGSVAFTDYILTDENGDILKSFVPDKSKVAGASGFSLTKDGSAAKTVYLKNADVVLYPKTGDNTDAAGKTTDDDIKYTSLSKVNAYNGSFSDVQSDKWYAKEIASAFETGLMNGVSDSLFSPDGFVTVAEGITIASRINAAFTGKTVPQKTSANWYDAFVDYAFSKEIAAKGDFDSFTRNITRGEMAFLIYNALPSSLFNGINDVYSIPDVAVDSPYHTALLTLYRAGVVLGSDDYGSFKPDSDIRRSEVAAIINRVSLPENRLHGSLAYTSDKSAFSLCNNSVYSADAQRGSINSGWVLDNRGGVPRLTPDGNYDVLYDISDKFGTALIREFNNVSGGKVAIETAIDVTGNGVFVEVRDRNEKTSYKIRLENGSWEILGDDGKYTVIMKNAYTDGTKKFKLRIYLDLDGGKSETYINDTLCGEYKLNSDNIISFRFATDEKSMVSLTPYPINIVANYALYEDFATFGTEQVYGWKKSGNTSIIGGEMVLDGEADVEKTFDGVSGKYIAESYIILPEGENFTFSLISDNSPVVSFEAKDGKFLANGTELYTYSKNMWYRLRIEGDTQRDNADILLNGRKIGTVSAAKCDKIDGLSIKSAGNAKLDNIRVYANPDVENYVPVPETKASFDDYIVGINVCPLWRNGSHSAGWSCITPFTEPRPLMGLYDEGTPENADWEIKYMVEHGIDFQAFCWYGDKTDSPIKSPNALGGNPDDNLHSGYMYAKYSDYMKYAILWEAMNGAKFNSKQFRENVVPYWFENYFLDERYMTINNRLVLCIFKPEVLATKYFGSIEGVKAELDYLNSVAKSYGFDGMIIMSCTSSSDELSAMGIDASYAYSHGTAGNSFEVNKTRILDSAKVTSMVTVPTISVGFDSMPWYGTRYPNMSLSDYEKCHDWVKNTYLPQYGVKGSWNEKLVMISTWNEYGEGTYIMPAGLNGFGYLDVLRKEYTNLPDDHDDTVPDGLQRERINHLYPQYQTLIRPNGYYKENSNSANASLYINDFAVKSTIKPEMSDVGLLFPFDVQNGIDFRLNSFATWRRFDGTLKIEANGHTVIFTVGSDKYIADGVEKDLGITIYCTDGVPMLPIKILSDALGFDANESSNEVSITTEQYDLLHTKVTEPDGEWNFEQYDLGKWSSEDMSLSCFEGILIMKSMIRNEDPKMYLSGAALDSEKFTGLEIKARYSFENSANKPYYACLYYITNKDKKWDEKKTVKLAFSSLDSEGEWVTLRADFAGNSQWKDIITGLRFDPFTGIGTMEIDYIHFILNENYVERDIYSALCSITNGDAEDTENVAFTSKNGKVQIVEDTSKAGNHVYDVSTNLASNYTSISQSVTFEKGKTYKVEFDVRATDDSSGNDDIEGLISCDICYPDESALNKLDHLTGPVKVGKNIGWVHYSKEFTIGEPTSDSNHSLRIYSNPVGTRSLNFQIDNVVITQVK